MCNTRLLLRIIPAFLLAAVLGGSPVQAADKDDKPPPNSGSIDAATGKILTEAIEALNAENYPLAKQAISKLSLDKLSPYERSRTEQILATIASAQDNYDSARNHLQAAIAAGGLNEKEISDTRYQIAQMFLAQ